MVVKPMPLQQTRGGVPVPEDLILSVAEPHHGLRDDRGGIWDPAQWLTAAANAEASVSS
jgi:hypothetical protein